MAALDLDAVVVAAATASSFYPEITASMSTTCGQVNGFFTTERGLTPHLAGLPIGSHNIG
jgi:hypothetical protein